MCITAFNTNLSATRIVLGELTDETRFIIYKNDVRPSSVRSAQAEREVQMRKTNQTANRQLSNTQGISILPPEALRLLRDLEQLGQPTVQSARSELNQGALKMSSPYLLVPTLNGLSGSNRVAMPAMSLWTL